MNNSTESEFYNDYYYGYFPETRYWVIAPFVFLIFTTCGTNALVMILIAKDSNLKGITYKYVSSLAVADFLVGLIVMLGMMVLTMYGYWPLHPFLCTIFISADLSMCGVSIFHLLIIAYDRFVATVYPMTTYLQSRTNKEKWARIKIAVAWIVGLGVAVPDVVITRHNQLKEGIIPETLCIVAVLKWRALAIAIVTLYIPILLILYFYARIVYALYQNRKSVEEVLTSKVEFVSSAEQSNSQNLKKGKISEFERLAKDRQYKRQKRTTLTVGIITFAFLICWLPFCTLMPTHIFCECVSFLIFEIAYWAAYLNSTINPILYFLINTDIRNATKRLLWTKNENRSESYESGSNTTDSSKF